ncbi:MAG: T9SS type A sorting domain-containing protein [Saprospiraceae bacterium]|nr:T9SS type A sorting domain-containing protein [Saprospiraceae bacterium]
MKKIFLLLLILSAVQFLKAQSELVLRFNHQLYGKNFSLNQEALSPMGTKYKITRLQFYLSGFKITHDGGQVSNLNTIYLFVDPSNKTSKEFSLGLQNDITSIEKIEFAVGVDAASNHLDPASYPVDHALAPKNPTMHWGWTSGYRFISLSANAARTNGLFLDAVNIEGLGDVNFKPNSYTVTGKSENGKIYIDMIAEYNKLLEGISIAGGATNHGETGIAASLVLNGSSIVFGPASPTATKESSNKSFSSVVYNSNQIYIQYDLNEIKGLNFSAYDLNGNLVTSQEIKTSKGTIQIDNNLLSGTYFYSFRKSNNVLSSGKIVKR